MNKGISLIGNDGRHVYYDGTIIQKIVCRGADVTIFTERPEVIEFTLITSDLAEYHCSEVAKKLGMIKKGDGLWLKNGASS